VNEIAEMKLLIEMNEIAEMKLRFLKTEQRQETIEAPAIIKKPSSEQSRTIIARAEEIAKRNEIAQRKGLGFLGLLSN
jgi:hypothetical protein